MGTPVRSKARERITAAMARGKFTYNPDTGDIRVRRPYRNQPSDGGCICVDKGRPTIWMFGARFQASHVAWLIHYGEWPNLELDHRDRDPMNIRILNLRDCSAMKNCMNQPVRANNRLGLKGVTAHKNGWYWSRISADGVRYHLGLYPEPWMAAAAYRIAAAGMHGEYSGV